MSWNKADQLLKNEERKIDVKIRAKEQEIRKLKADKEEIHSRINSQ